MSLNSQSMKKAIQIMEKKSKSTCKKRSKLNKMFQKVVKKIVPQRTWSLKKRRVNRWVRVWVIVMRVMIFGAQERGRIALWVRRISHQIFIVLNKLLNRISNGIELSRTKQEIRKMNFRMCIPILILNFSSHKIYHFKKPDLPIHALI